MTSSQIKATFRTGLINLLKGVNFRWLKNRKLLLNQVLSQANVDKETKRIANLGHVASGYIPYVHKRTKIHLYHFFSFNYGHRKPYKVVISLFGNGLKPLCSKEVTLETRTNICIDISNLFGQYDISVEATTCTLSIIHERITPNHAGHEGHLRFWGIYSEDSAFVHSMPLPSSINLMRGQFTKKLSASRRCFHNNAHSITCFSIFGSVIEVQERGEIDDKELAPSGYIVCRDLEQQVTGCWHTAANYIKNLTANDVKPYVIHIPPIENIDGQLYFKECCTDGSKFKLEAMKFSTQNDEAKTIFKCKIFVNLQDDLLISDIIPKEILQEKGIWLKITPLKGSFSNRHMNIIYVDQRTNKPLDCVHNHHYAEARGNCLKFAPFSEEGNKESWIAINGAKNRDVKIRLRFTITNDENTELLFLEDITKNVVKYFRVDDFLKNYNFSNSRGVVQVESLDANVGCTMYIAGSKGSYLNLAADHFTGG